MISDQELDKGLLTLKMIWLAMLASLAIYVFIGLQVATNLPVSLNDDTFGILRTVLYAVAFATLIITRYVRRLLLSAKGGHRRAVQTSQHSVLQKYAVAEIAAWAMSESVGIYGLVLFLLGKNTTDLYLLMLISTAAMIMYRPSKNEVNCLIQESSEAVS